MLVPLAYLSEFQQVRLPGCQHSASISLQLTRKLSRVSSMKIIRLSSYPAALL